MHVLHAAALAQEIRLTMPTTELVQLTDQTTPVVPGVSRVSRLPHGPMLQRRLEHYAGLDGEWILLDTDVRVMADLRDVFHDVSFDVALTDRDWPHLVGDPNAGASGSPIADAMPYNTGVVFTRCQRFWGDVLSTWLGFPDEQRASWFSEQQAVARVVSDGRYRIKVLPGMVYNYPPASKDDCLETAKLLHYKGQRKAWRTAQIYDQWRAAA